MMRRAVPFASGLRGRSRSREYDRTITQADIGPPIDTAAHLLA
jgi:hypothetical protein